MTTVLERILEAARALQRAAEEAGASDYEGGTVMENLLIAQLEVNLAIEAYSCNE